MKPKSSGVTVAYRCPECGRPIYGMKGFFTLSGDLFRLKCSCESGSVAEIRREKNKTVISVPCLICSGRHSFSVDENTEYSDSVVSLRCPLSGLEIGAVGKPDDIEGSFASSEDFLVSALEDSGFDSLENFIAAKKADAKKKKNDIGDRVSTGELYSVISCFLSELNERRGIVCSCPPGEQSPACGVGEDGLTISCDKCGKKAVVPFAQLLDPYSLAEIDRIVLK
ncbi:MAG: hypothetical protein J5563_06805 [Clostridia bacterium]|nr:hypothetical protein [Clostridia bacterium]